MWRVADRGIVGGGGGGALVLSNVFTIVIGRWFTSYV